MKRLPSNLVNRRVLPMGKSTKSATTHRAASSETQHRSHGADGSNKPAEKLPEKLKREPGFRPKTTQELDEELRSRLEMMSGSGGAAGIEYEDGRAEGMKREVKRNMFRVI
jgi:hypothetical protein